MAWKEYWYGTVKLIQSGELEDEDFAFACIEALTDGNPEKRALFEDLAQEKVAYWEAHQISNDWIIALKEVLQHLDT